MSDSDIEDEIELIDLLRVIWSRRFFIIFTTLILMAGAGGVGKILPKKYETTALIQIGRVWEKEIENPYLTKEWISSEAFLSQIIKKLGLNVTPDQMRKKKSIEAKVLESGPSANKTPLLLSVRVHDEIPQQTVDIVEAVADLLIETHQVRFRERLHEYQAYEEGLSNDVSQIEKAIRELELLIKKQQLAPVVNAPSVILLQSQLEQKNVQLLGFKRELKDVRINNHSKIMTENTRLISSPIRPTEPVAPRVFFLISLTGALGGAAALFLAFFLEYLKQARSRETESLKSKKKKERLAG